MKDVRGVTVFGNSTGKYGMPVAKGIKALVKEAYEKVETWTVDDAIRRVNDEDIQLVDIRDIRELWREGTVPGSVHAPRGMLEFWIDPDSPYHREVFATEKKLVFFCAAGWRSALAGKTVQEMGLANVAHIDGGFKAWKERGGPVEEKPQPAPKKG
ncbi:MAG: rhodanese-like domain-containing protein [Rhodospirillaceae bacterium]|nr:rhodanese-like domain-containing protein [Rhodospirillaceae bacterium]MCY4236881.1 rhodanese-like domain-containing protein [Rhodospirillaceae bacterium]